MAIIADRSGGVLFLSEVAGDAQVGGARLSAPSDHDVLIARFDATGRLAWAKPLLTPRTSLDSVCVDAAGDVFLLASMHPRYGDPSLLLIKLDRDGKRLWTRQFPAQHAEGITLRVSRGGQLLMTGQLGRSLDFGSRELRLPEAGRLVPQTGDWFVAGFDAAGQHVSSRLLGRAVVMAATASGERFVVAARTTEDTLDLGGGHRVSRGNFVAAFDGSGQVAWKRQVAGDIEDSVGGPGGSVRLLVYSPAFSLRCHNAHRVERISLLTLGADGETVGDDTIRLEGKSVALVLLEDGRLRTRYGLHEGYWMATVGQDGSVFELAWDPVRSTDDSVRGTVSKHAW